MIAAILKWVGSTAAFIGVLMFIYHLGGESARKECDAAAVRQELAIAKQELREAEKKHVEADQRAQQMAGRATSNQEKADALAQDLEAARNQPAPPAPAPVIVNGKCPAPPAPHVYRGLSDGDVGKLRGIHGR